MKKCSTSLQPARSSLRLSARFNYKQSPSRQVEMQRAAVAAASQPTSVSTLKRELSRRDDIRVSAVAHLLATDLTVTLTDSMSLI